jgi:hypothetical protein
MIARGFKPVGWVAAVAGAALGCYMLSLNVASERAELAGLERKIIRAKQDIRTLQTELGTRGRMSQLEHWNAEVLALSAPTSNQFLESEIVLARFDKRAPTIEDRSANVQLAAATTVSKPQARPALAAADYAAAATAAEKTPIEKKSLVQRASLVVGGDAPLKPAKPAALPVTKPVKPIETAAKAAPAPAAKPKKAAPVSAELVREIGETAKSEKTARTEKTGKTEKKAGGAGGR